MGVIFANLVQHFHEVPALAHFRFLGIPMNDKWIYYMTAGAMACWQGTPSLLSALFGTLIGSLYRAKGVGLSNARIPNVISRLVQSVVSPILSVTDQTAGPQLTTPSSTTNTARGRVNAPQGNLFANRAQDQFEEIPEHLRNQVQPSEPNIATLVDMGFSRERAMQALAETGDSVDLAVALLTSE